tara:strand:- start:822 stop:2030 length:1209 start_codon:yes stop_codon:yes gene_type:complete
MKTIGDIKPKLLPNGKWQCDLGRLHMKFELYDPRPEKNGKKVGRYTTHDSKHEADKWLALLDKESRSVDLNMSPSHKIEFKQARSMLDEAGFENITIIDAVKSYLKYKPLKTDETVMECYESWIASYESKTRSKRTIEDVKRVGRGLEPFAEETITNFEQPEYALRLIRHIQETWTNPRTQTNQFTKTNQFFNWCSINGKLTKNPIEGRYVVEKINFHEDPRILTVEETESLLRVARETDEELGMLAFWVIALFLGLRPSEIERLTWNDFDFSDPKNPQLRVPQCETGKNKRARRIDLTPQVMKWVDKCNRDSLLYPPAYNKRRRIVLKKAGILDLKADTNEKRKLADVCRHSCGSYMYQAGWTEKQITARLGHTSEVFRHFYQNCDVREADAQRYFNIMPT